MTTKDKQAYERYFSLSLAGIENNYLPAYYRYNRLSPEILIYNSIEIIFTSSHSDICQSHLTDFIRDDFTNNNQSIFTLTKTERICLRFFFSLSSRLGMVLIFTIRFN